MFYISVSDAIKVRLYLQTCERKKTILNRLAFKKLNFSSYTQVPVLFTTLGFVWVWGFFFTMVVVLAVLLYPIKIQKHS